MAPNDNVIRENFAAEIAAVGGLTSAALIDAFALVPRESFLPPGPWLVEAIEGSLYRTPDADLSRVLHAVGVCLDERRQLINANPARIGRLIEAADVRPGETVLHIGAGLGYYTAILAQLVGAQGRVLATEIDPDLVARARSNLADLRQVEVVGDMPPSPLPPLDVIYASAGVTTIPRDWTEALTVGGRLLLPLTGTHDTGPVFLFQKTADPAWYTAKRCTFMRFYPAVGMRDLDGMKALDQALADRRGEQIGWLRLDTHAPGPGCWLHRPDYCLGGVSAEV